MPAYNNPGCIEACNTYPSPQGFAQFEGLFGSGDTLTEPAQGAQQFFRSSGDAVVVAGGATILAVRDSGSVTETTGYTALGPEQRWRFERFNDLVVAVSPSTDPQYLADIDIDTTFVDLPGSPPVASIIGRVGDFLVLGDIADFPNRIQWSNFNNPTGDWDVNVGDLSGFIDLKAKYGKVTGIVQIAANAGIVFQERAFSVLTFVGAPRVFNAAEVSTDIGCVAPDSIVQVGSNVYFLGQDGFYYTNGALVDRIGANRVDKTFLNAYNETYQGLVQGAVNWPKQCIIWAYNTNGPLLYQRQFIFSFASNRWARSETDTYTLVETKQDSLTLTDLTTTYGTIGNMPFAIGSSNYKGKSLLGGAFAPDGSGGSEFSTFSGSALECVVQTGVRQTIPGYRTTVTGAAPLIENGSENTLTQVIAQDSLTQVTSTSPASVAVADGFCPHHINGRYMSMRMIVPEGATWEKALGIQARARPAGRR